MRWDWALCFVLLGLAAPAWADISGTAEVIDSDKIKVGEQRIVLHGIDSIERDQICTADGQPWECWPAAVRHLQTLLADGPVTCRELGPAPFGYVYAVCQVAERDVGETMVRDGMALAFRTQSEDYVAAEEQAQSEGIGLWAAEFVEPWEWRKHKRRPWNQQ